MREMELTPSAVGLAPRIARTRFDWNAVTAWLVGFVPVVYLGLSGGGYDPLVHDQVGIAVWWIILAGAAIGAFPQRRLSAGAWCALGVLAAFAVWTALSLGWTDSAERTSADLARVATFLGIFALALLARGPDWSRRAISAVSAAIVLVATVALLSRFHPVWFPSSTDTARFLTSERERLSFPLNYWNGLGGLVAIGFPLLLYGASTARTAAVRGLCGAALPALGLTLFLTLSRGGIAATVVAIGVFLALAPDRLPRLGALSIAAAGSAILIVATLQRAALQHGLTGHIAQHQGNEMLALTLVVCAAAGLLQLGLAVLLLNDLRPPWTHVSRRQTTTAAIAVGVCLLVAAAAVDAPGRLSGGWEEFKQPGVGTHGSGRLGTVAGESRYQYWKAAVREMETRPLAGTGSGTFEFWWTRHGDGSGQVIDAHSLYMQTLGELGLPGLILLAAFLLSLFVAGISGLLRCGGDERAARAAGLAACTAFCVTATFDWTWQIPVLPFCFLILASTLLAAGPRTEARAGGTASRWLLRGGGAALAIAALAAIAIPLASTSLTRESQTDARDGNSAAALTAALSAENVQPDAAGPRLQAALVLEAQGKIGQAAAAAGAAAEQEPDNWRNWLVLSRLQAERGNARGAITAYRRARTLNPYSSLFTS